MLASAALILLPDYLFACVARTPIPKGSGIRQTFWHFAGAIRHGWTFC